MAAANEQRAENAQKEERLEQVRQLCAANGLPAYSSLSGCFAVSRYLATGEKKSDEVLLASIRAAQAEYEQRNAAQVAREERTTRVRDLLIGSGLPYYYTFSCSAVAFFIETGKSCTGHGRAVYAVPAVELERCPNIPRARPRAPYRRGHRGSCPGRCQEAPRQEARCRSGSSAGVCGGGCTG